MQYVPSASGDAVPKEQSTYLLLFLQPLLQFVPNLSRIFEVPRMHEKHLSRLSDKGSQEQAARTSFQSVCLGGGVY